MASSENKEIVMISRTSTIIDDDELVELPRLPKSSRVRKIRVYVLSICFTVIGTLLLAVHVHYQCTTYGKFSLLDQVYECKWLGDTVKVKQ